MNAHISIRSDQITKFCERWLVTEMALLGSVLREDFGSKSDIDVLIEFKEEARHSLFDMVQMERELEAIFDREVDLVERMDIERSQNYLRRQSILQSVETIYAE